MVTNSRTLCRQPHSAVTGKWFYCSWAAVLTPGSLVGFTTLRYKQQLGVSTMRSFTTSSEAARSTLTHHRKVPRAPTALCKQPPFAGMTLSYIYSLTQEPRLTFRNLEARELSLVSHFKLLCMVGISAPPKFFWMLVQISMQRVGRVESLAPQQPTCKLRRGVAIVRQS